MGVRDIVCDPSDVEKDGKDSVMGRLYGERDERDSVRG